MEKKFDKAVSHSLYRVYKYSIRAVAVLFIGLLFANTFYLNGENLIVSRIVYILMIILFLIFLIFHLIWDMANRYENKIEQGIKYLNYISSHLKKIRYVLSLPDKEIIEKIRINAIIDKINIPLKNGSDKIVKEIRQGLVEEEEMYEIFLLQGYNFPQKPPKSYVFWRKKILGIPPMTVGTFRENL